MSDRWYIRLSLLSIPECELSVDVGTLVDGEVDWQTGVPLWFLVEQRGLKLPFQSFFVQNDEALRDMIVQLRNLTLLPHLDSILGDETEFKKSREHFEQYAKSLRSPEIKEKKLPLP